MADRKRSAASSDSSSSSVSSSDSDSSDNEIGPQVPAEDGSQPQSPCQKDATDPDNTDKHSSSRKAKKPKKLEFEKIFLEDLPNCERYEKSFMHRDVVTHTVTCKGGFIITASADGHIKFW